MSAQPLRVIEVGPCAVTVDVLRDLLRDAEAGELVSFAGCFEYVGSYRTVHAGATDTAKLAGMCLLAGMRQFD